MKIEVEREEWLLVMKVFRLALCLALNDPERERYRTAILEAHAEHRKINAQDSWKTKKEMES